jgi:hypothetical protein
MQVHLFQNAKLLQERHVLDFSLQLDTETTVLLSAIVSLNSKVSRRKGPVAVNI